MRTVYTEGCRRKTDSIFPTELPDEVASVILAVYRNETARRTQWRDWTNRSLCPSAYINRNRSNLVNTITRTWEFNFRSRSVRYEFWQIWAIVSPWRGTRCTHNFRIWGACPFVVHRLENGKSCGKCVPTQKRISDARSKSCGPSSRESVAVARF